MAVQVRLPSVEYHELKMKSVNIIRNRNQTLKHLRKWSWKGIFGFNFKTKCKLSKGTWAHPKVESSKTLVIGSN